jgi:hypothetical protein
MNTDPIIVRDLMVVHYVLFAFISSLGTLQISATLSGAQGLWLTPHRLTTRTLGILLIVTAFVIFFTQPLWVEGPWAAGSVEADSVSRKWGTTSWSELAGARNVNDIHGGLDGVQQAIWFPVAVALAFVVSAVAGALNVKISAANTDTDKKALEKMDGIAGLSCRSYYTNLLYSLRIFRSEFADEWNEGLSMADSWSVFRMIFRRSPD